MEHAITFITVCFGIFLLCLGYTFVHEARSKWKYWRELEATGSKSQPEDGDAP